MTEKRLRTNGQWTRSLKGVHESGMVEALDKQVKHVGKGGGTFEGVSNDAIIVTLRWTVGRHARIGASESNAPEQKKKISWRGTAQQKLQLSAANFVLVT